MDGERLLKLKVEYCTVLGMYSCIYIYGRLLGSSKILLERYLMLLRMDHMQSSDIYLVVLRYRLMNNLGSSQQQLHYLPNFYYVVLL